MAPLFLRVSAHALGTGRGLSDNELGPRAAPAIDRMTEPWTTRQLVPQLPPSLEGRPRLRRFGNLYDEVRPWLPRGPTDSGDVKNEGFHQVRWVCGNLLFCSWRSYR